MTIEGLLIRDRNLMKNLDLVCQCSSGTKPFNWKNREETSTQAEVCRICLGTLRTPIPIGDILGYYVEKPRE